MPSGGARTRSGPAPDPNALRRVRDEGEWSTLPNTGLERMPAWPLTAATDREMVLWQDLWTSKPQAHMWERFSLNYEVAMFVRRFAESERPRSAVILGTLVRQMADSLGLTTPGMRANRWKIAAGDDTQGSQARTTRRASQSSRSRMRIVPPVDE